MNTMHENKTWMLGGDLKVNRFGYGAMRLTGKGVWGEPENKSEAIRVLQRAVDLGVNFIDTADSYGPYVSEKLIAKALYPYPKDLVIATKGGFERTGPNEWLINGNPAHLKEALEGSLKRLKVDCIDLYQLHRIDSNVPSDETIGYLKEAQEKGLIKHIGLSEVNIEVLKAAEKQVKIVSLQNKYSLDCREWEAELQYCATNAIAFIPWNPIDAGKLKPNEKVKELAQKYGVTAPQVALKWLFNHAENILLIPGTSSVSHLEENLGTQAFSFNQSEFEALDKKLSLI